MLNPGANSRLTSAQIRTAIAELAHAKKPAIPPGAIESGTAIVALKYKDGVVIGADRQTSCGDKIFSHDFKKIRMVSQQTALGGAGYAYMLQIVNDVFAEALASVLHKTDGSQLPIVNQAKLLKRIIRQLSLQLGGLGTDFIFAGANRDTEETIIVRFDQVGGLYVIDAFTAIGSGGDEAITTLRNAFGRRKPWASDLTKDAAVKLAIEALIASAEDVYVGHPKIDPPLILSLDCREGNRWIEKETVARLVKKLLRGGRS